MTTKRPPRPFLTAQWRHLVMVNYRVEASLLQPYVPAGTELDSHDGHRYASVVAFQFLNTRVLGVPIPFHRNFTELNLRFYVRRAVNGQLRRGVVFIREVVPRPAIALIARVAYNEPYVSLPMRSSVGSIIRHEWRLGGQWHSLSTRPAGETAVPKPGSHAEFITDHEWGYSRQRGGGTVEYRVSHVHWAVQKAANLEIKADFAALYGPALATALTSPATAFVIDGSPVTVGRPTTIA